MGVMQALERALRTGTVLLIAAQADALWSVGCGDAIEDAKQAINRYTAICTPHPSGTHVSNAQIHRCMMGRRMPAAWCTAECLDLAI